MIQMVRLEFGNKVRYSTFLVAAFSIFSMAVITASLYFLSDLYWSLANRHSFLTIITARALVFAVSVGLLALMLRLYVYLLDRSKQQEIDKVRGYHKVLFDLSNRGELKETLPDGQPAPTTAGPSA